MSVAAPPVDHVAPAFFHLPDGFDAPAAAEACELAAAAGIPLDPEQKLQLQVILAESHGQTVFESCVIEARQNGKSYAEMVAALDDIYIQELELVVWTAHEFPTAMRSFKEFKEVIAGTPFLARRVRKERNANGEEGFLFVNGSELWFRARTKTGGRGIAGDRVVLDEAFALDDGHIGALIPILSSRPGSAVRYASSAGLLRSAFLRGLRARGRSGVDPSLSYIEHAAPQDCDPECDHSRGRPGCACDDPEHWRMANPGIARRRSDWKDYIAKERRTMPVVEFARERMGWWEDPVSATADVPMEQWMGLADRVAAPADPVFVALDCAPGGTAAAIVVCGSDARDGDDPDAAAVVELVRHERRTRWVVDTLTGMRENLGEFRPVLDPAGSAGALIPDLERAGFDPVLLSGREVTQACGAFVSALADSRLLHRDESGLNDAIAGLRLRPVGDAHKFSRRDSTHDICPAVAAGFAHYAWLSAAESDDAGPPNVW